MNVKEKLKESAIIAVIRKANENNIEKIVESLYRGGITTVEITAETPNVFKLIEKVTFNFDGKVLVGAGTVLDPETARLVIMAGAKFIVSPSLNVNTIKMANRYGVLNASGALTPTEIITAYESGADLIKVFPANLFGPQYIKSIHGPFPQIPIMVTGGIELDNMNSYLEEGCAAIGLGSNLVNTENLKTTQDYKQLTNQAAKYVEKLQIFRGR